MRNCLKVRKICLAVWNKKSAALTDEDHRKGESVRLDKELMQYGRSANQHASFFE